MKYLHSFIVVLTYLNIASAQFPFFGFGRKSDNEGMLDGIRKAVNDGFSGGVQGLQSGLSKGLVGGLTGGLAGAAGTTLKGITKSTFGDKKNAKETPAVIAHTLTNGITAGLEGFHNNLDKGVVQGITSFAKETNSGIKKGVTTGAYIQFKSTFQDITSAAFEEFKEMLPELVAKYKSAIYTALSMAAIQAAAKLYHSVAVSKQPPLRRMYDKILTNL